jgi:hypothetical protein
LSNPPNLQTEKVHYLGLLSPLPIPNQNWTDISLDFIEGLPKSKGKDVILVVVDRLTKYAHFIPLSHPYTVNNVADMFMENIIKLHGPPASIISDTETRSSQAPSRKNSSLHMIQKFSTAQLIT